MAVEALGASVALAHNQTNLHQCHPLPGNRAQPTPGRRRKRVKRRVKRRRRMKRRETRRRKTKRRKTRRMRTRRRSGK